MRVENRRRGQGVVFHVPGVAKAFEKTADPCRFRRAMQGAGEQTHCASVLPGLVKTGQYEFISLFPLRGLAIEQRLRHTLAVVKPENRSLTHGAQTAPRNRMVGIPFQFDRPPVPDLHQRAAGRGAGEACRGVVNRSPGYEPSG